MPQETSADAQRLREILATAKRLAVEYYQLTGKPLGVTGEVAEYVAAETLGLKLAPPRTHGYDALRGIERYKSKAGRTARRRIRGRKFDRHGRKGPFSVRAQDQGWVLRSKPGPSGGDQRL